jgi:MFS family permease
MSSAVRRDLRRSMIEGMAASTMLGLGETYLPVFVLALSGSQLACGLSSTVPLLIGALVQLASPWLMRRYGSYRRWVSLCALVQACVFLPLAAAAIAGRMPVMLVFALISVYWATGLGPSGPWNAWMETLVPPRVRAQYFARRTSVCQWGIGLGFVAGGVALELAEQRGAALAAFAVLFVMAAASRFASAGLLAGQREPHAPPRNAPSVTWSGTVRSLTTGTKGRLLVYLMAAQAATQISSPYCNPYLLDELHFSYAIYATVICAAIAAKIAFLPTVGRIADRIGAQRVFWISSAAIVPVPALWLVSRHAAYLIGVQIYTGMAWCAFDLATLLLFIETIPRHKRVDVLSLFNLANAAAIAGGSLLGAYVLTAFGAGARGYFVLFTLSSISRAAAILVVVRSPARSIGGDAAVLPSPHFVRNASPRRSVPTERSQDIRETMAGSL